MIQNKKLSETSAKWLKESIQNKGIIFEDEIADSLSNIFDASLWNISQSYCLREVPIHEGFNERYEIDFLARRIDPLHLNSRHPIQLRSYEHLLDPILLIEAKWSSYDWCFFHYKKLKDTDKSFNLTVSKDEAYFSETFDWQVKDHFISKKLKRSIPLRFDQGDVVLNKKGTVETTERDLVRDGVRQIAKNMQVYLGKIENDEMSSAAVFPVIVTNSCLKIFDYNDISSYQETDCLCFELDDFMFWRGEKICTKFDGKLKALSKFHVWIVNFEYLEHFVRRIIPECVL